jgi:hypothetical protein
MANSLSIKQPLSVQLVIDSDATTAGTRPTLALNRALNFFDYVNNVTAGAGGNTLVLETVTSAGVATTRVDLTVTAVAVDRYNAAADFPNGAAPSGTTLRATANANTVRCAGQVWFIPGAIA